MSVKLKIRTAQLPDIEKIVEMQLAIQRHHESSNPSVWRYTEKKEEVMRQDLKLQLINDEHLILLAEDRKEIVGFIHGDIQHSPVHIPKYYRQNNVNLCIRRKS